MFKVGLESLYFSGVHKLARPKLGGVGVIFTLHRVVARNPRPFHPNGILEIEPEFLDQVITRVKQQGLDIVDLDEAYRRLTTPGEHRRFAAFTLDDGYRDNRDNALPVFRKHECPFTVYIPTGYPDGQGCLWWLGLEEVIAKQDTIALTMGDTPAIFDTGTLEAKKAVFDKVYWWMRSADEDVVRDTVKDMAARYGVDMAAMCRDLVMDWTELAAFARDPLVTIGAHTVDHYALAKQPPQVARSQMAQSVNVIESVLGKRPAHFAYPYGSPCAAGRREFDMAKELGFRTAVTTRPGLIYADHAQHLMALPRVSLNGNFQSLRYLDVLLSGLPFYLFNGMERLNVA